MPLARLAASLTLVALAILASIVSAGSVPHTHIAGQPGLFNQEHDLSTLAALSGPAPLPVPFTVGVLVVALALALPDAPRLRSQHPGNTPSRAPPAVA